MKGLKNRIKELEYQLGNSLIDWGKIYDLVKEMDRTIGHSEDENFDEYYASTFGTKEEFIKMKKRGTA